MEESILKILKDKDDFRTVVEIKENAKGEPQISVKVRDDSMQQAVERAIDAYRTTKKELAK